MGEVFSRARWTTFKLEAVLSGDVRDLLKPLGFSKTARTFTRQRGPLWDMVNFQRNKYNRVTPYQSFFVNVGVGSSEIDAVWRTFTATPIHSRSIYDQRWESVVPNLPWEVIFDLGTETDTLAALLCEGLERVLPVLEEFTTTDDLVQWAIANNKLHRMEPVCSYLAAIGDTERLRAYIGALRADFGHQPRWEIFNRDLVHATYAISDELIALGILDPLPEFDDYGM